jgi:hypothetical protein
VTNAPKHLRAYLLLCGLGILWQPLPGLAQQKAEASRPSGPRARTERDGRHDFDFEMGTWRVHNSRLLHPLTGDTTWSEFEGTAVARRVWGGRADLVELESDSPAGHSEGLILRLYDPQSHQWSVTFANSKNGTLSQPAIGEFTNGHGEFFNQDVLKGRIVLARSVVSDITSKSYRVEFALSDDGGKTWEVNWISVHTRVRD